MKKWADDEEKTDYNLVYWIYSLMSIVLFLYLIYILGLNPKLKSQKGGANMFDTNINITAQNESGDINSVDFDNLKYAYSIHIYDL